MSAVCQVRSATLYRACTAAGRKTKGGTAMPRKHYALSSAAIALCVVGLPQSASSYGGRAQNPWNPAHLSNLPPEMRTQAEKWKAACGAPVAAARQFALYLTTPSAQFAALHFDDFQCVNRGVVCDASGCLHEVYVKAGGRYRKVLTLHAQDVRLVREQDAAFLEIQDRSGGVRRLLRWNGSHFVTRAGTENR